MPFSLSVPVACVGPDTTTAIPPSARRLLDSGAVLAWRATMALDGANTTMIPGVEVALPHPTQGAVWLSNPEDIIAQASHIPGLLEAVFALGQRAFTTFSPHAQAVAWAPHLPTTGDPVLVDITLLPSGMALGQHDPAYSMDAELDDLIAAIEEDEPTCTSFDTGMLVCLALPVSPALSAHARCALPTTAARLLAEWKRALPGWMEGWADDLTLAFAPPDADAIGAALSRFATEPL